MELFFLRNLATHVGFIILHTVRLFIGNTRDFAKPIVIYIIWSIALWLPNHCRILAEPLLESNIRILVELKLLPVVRTQVSDLFERLVPAKSL